jgi:hypothetical protein
LFPAVLFLIASLFMIAFLFATPSLFTGAVFAVVLFAVALF